MHIMCIHIIHLYVAAYTYAHTYEHTYTCVPTVDMVMSKIGY